MNRIFLFTILFFLTAVSTQSAPDESKTIYQGFETGMQLGGEHYLNVHYLLGTDAAYRFITGIEYQLPPPGGIPMHRASLVFGYRRYLQPWLFIEYRGHLHHEMERAVSRSRIMDNFAIWNDASFGVKIALPNEWIPLYLCTQYQLGMRPKELSVTGFSATDNPFWHTFIAALGISW
jgi:hypothetical protein